MAKMPLAAKAVEEKTILVVGASSDMGFAAAKGLASQDHSVCGAARRVERMAPPTEYDVHAIKLDVTDKRARKNVVGWVIAKRGCIDMLVNNAGYGSYGTVGDVEIDEVCHQFDVNVFGLVALTKTVLLHICEGRSDTIVDVSNIGERLVSFMGGWYHATKCVVEALSDALRMEAVESDVDVVLIEPDGIKTEWADITAGHLAESSKGGAYEQTAVKTAEGMRRQYSSKMMSDPDIVVRTISRAVNAKRPRPRYLVGFGVKPLVATHVMLPTRASDWVMKKAAFAPGWQK